MQVAVDWTSLPVCTQCEQESALEQDEELQLYQDALQEIQRVQQELEDQRIEAERLRSVLPQNIQTNLDKTKNPILGSSLKACSVDEIVVGNQDEEEGDLPPSRINDQIDGVLEELVSLHNAMLQSQDLQAQVSWAFSWVPSPLAVCLGHNNFKDTVEEAERTVVYAQDYLAFLQFQVAAVRRSCRVGDRWARFVVATLHRQRQAWSRMQATIHFADSSRNRSLSQLPQRSTPRCTEGNAKKFHTFMQTLSGVPQPVQ